MKATLSALLLFLCTLHSFAQADNDLAGEGLKGKVKTVTELQYYERDKSPYMKTVDKYDARGILVEEIHNDYLLKLNIKRTIKYDTDSKGNVVQLKEVDDAGNEIRSVKHRYDSLQRLTETEDSRMYDGSKADYKSEYSYDSAGRMVSVQTYANGKEDRKTVYTHNSRGRVSGTKSFDKKGKVVMGTDYNYLADAQWLHCEKQAGEVRTHIFRIVDTAGQIVERTTYTGDYSKHTTESFSNFDSYGNWLKQTIKGTITENYYVLRNIEYYK